MSRRKPAWLLERELKEAQDRETYYRNRTRPQKTTVDSRDTSQHFYRSTVLGDGTKGLLFRVEIGAKVLATLTPADLGLLAAQPTGETAAGIRGTGVRPAMVKAYKGDATPSPQRTAWGSRWIKYYSSANGSHISAPIAGNGATPTDKEARDRFNALTSGSGKLVTFCGKNGRAFYTPEMTPSAFNG